MIADYIGDFIMFRVGLWMSGVGLDFYGSRANLSPVNRRGGSSSAISNGWGPLLLIIAIVLAVGS